MSLNWKEINLILEELELPGMQIQKVVQSTYDTLGLGLYGKNGAKNLLVSISPGACRIHESFRPLPKSQKPLRFAQFLNSRIVNGRITEAVQFGQDRIIRLKIRLSHTSSSASSTFGSVSDPSAISAILYIRLWSNAANVIVTDTDGNVLDAMRRIPKKQEVTGGFYRPEEAQEETQGKTREYAVRTFPGGDSFNKKIDDFYRMEKGTLSLEALREEARKKYESSINRLAVSIENLKEKEKQLSNAEQLREQGDSILSDIGTNKNAAAEAAEYYEKYRKAKSGIVEIKKQIDEEEKTFHALEETLKNLLEEKDPLVLHKLLANKTIKTKEGKPVKEAMIKRPGLSFFRNDWLILAGRDASENDELLRKHVKGNDLWLHVRDYSGSYVFIKNKPGKSVPLDVLLDAGNLAIFYSKCRNRGEGDLFYTQVKYLRRVKSTSRGRTKLGKVIPTQEKNLYIKLDEKRLRELEEAKN